MTAATNDCSQMQITCAAATEYCEQMQVRMKHQLVYGIERELTTRADG